MSIARRSPSPRLLPYSFVLLFLLLSPGLVAQGDNGQISRMTFHTYIEKTASNRDYETDTVYFKVESGQLTLIGVFPSGNPARSPYQELTITVPNFHGRGTYTIADDRATWENLNTGDGLCHSLTGDLIVSSYDPQTGIDGTFKFRCESAPAAGDKLYTRIDGEFVKGLEPKILTPSEGDTLERFREVEITWKLPGRENVDLYITYEPDPERQGNERHEIAKNIDASLGTYTWEVPDTMSPQAFFLLVDPLDPEHPVVSDQLIARAPVLARIKKDPNGDCPNCPYYETFSVETHAWSPGNYPDNFATALRSDYNEKFNYVQGTDPITGQRYNLVYYISEDGKYQLNNLNRFYPEWPNWVRAFGVDACYIYAPVPQVQDYFVRDDIASLWAAYTGEPWTGSCHGLAVGAAMAFYSAGGMQSKFSGSISSLEQAREIKTVPLTLELKDDISTLFAYEFGKDFQGKVRDKLVDDPRSIVEELKEQLMRDDVDLTNGTSPVVVIENNGPDGGAHSLLVYEITQDENDDNFYYLFVYDPNHPDDPERSITIHYGDNKWGYDLGSVVWNATGDHIYLSDALQNYFDVADIEEDPVLTTISPTPRTSISAQGADGTTFSYSTENGYERTSGNGSDPLYSVNGPSRPYAFSLTPQSWSGTITPESDTGLSLLIQSKGLLLSYSSDAPPGASDNIRWDERSVTIENPGTTVRTIDVRGILRYENETRTIRANDFRLAGGDSVRFEIVDEDMIIANYGKETSYELTLRQQNSDGEKEGAYDRVTIGEKKTEQIDPAWWNIGTRLPVYIGANGSGATDTLYLVNALSSVDYQNRHSRFGFTNATGDVGHLSLSLEQPGMITVEAIDLLGRHVGTLYEGRNSSGDLNLPVPLSSLRPGTYLIRVMIDGKDVGAVRVVRTR